MAFMDDAWRHAASLLLMLTLVACPPPQRVGDPSDGWGEPAAPLPVSQPTKGTPTGAVIPEEKRKRWRYADEADAFQTVGGRGASEHLGGDYDRTVQINEQATAYRRLQGIPVRFPQGAILLQAHRVPGRADVVGFFAMRRGLSGWKFWILDPQLRVASNTDSARCLRCHVQSPQDSVFGPAPQTP